MEGKNIQDILIKEERIAKNLDVNNYQALSKFIPSEKQQKKNFELRQKLYKHSLSNYATFLTKDEINKLLTEKPSENYLEFDKNSPFADFLVSENTSVMFCMISTGRKSLSKTAANTLMFKKIFPNELKTAEFRV